MAEDRLSADISSDASGGAGMGAPGGGLAGRTGPSLEPRPMTVEEMLDRQALQQLAWSYCHACDRQDFKLLRSLYHDDAIDDHGPMFCGGPDEYIAWLPSMLANWSLTSHMITNMLFLIDGDEAEGELYAIAYHRTHGPDQREVIAGGRYVDRYQKRDGVWRFWRRSLVLDWMENRAVPPSEGPGIDDGLSVGRPDGSDPLFSRLPFFGAQYGGARP